MGVVFHLFLQSSRLSKKRAFLTIASIAWGTVSILLLLSFGEGMKRQFAKNRNSTGGNIAVMWPSETTKPWKGMPPGRPIRVMLDDVDYIRERMPELKNVWGELRSGRTSIAYGPKTVNAQVSGTSWVYGEARRHYPRTGGRFFGPLDEAEKRRVAFLGDELAKDIFGKEEPIGKTVLINNSPFTVIGVMVHKRQMGVYGGPDERHAVMPATTFKALFGRDRLWVLVIETHEPEEMAGALKRLNEVLGAKLGYDPTDDRALATWNIVKTSQVNRNISLGLQLFLGIIGVLTLVVGGVGVANIMYAVVRERTKEIGVKMALGARTSWITGPFVLEGLVYTLVGGAAGMLLAILIVTPLNYLDIEKNAVLEFLGRPTLSPAIGAVTAGVLGIIGLLAGYFPARRAAGINPAETLRYE
jgi:putative ABC transport system permease protein